MLMISVIVPVYKVESYLCRCIDSILAQTFTDFKLILVDDGSPDNCGRICDEYAEKDSRIHVIHKENEGLSAARNDGLDWCYANVDFDWVTFIDSDDWVHPCYLEALYNANISSHTYISMCLFERTLKHSVQFNTYNTEVKCMSPSKALNIYGQGLVCYACGRLYSRALWETERFPVGMYMEDIYIIPQIIYKAKEISVVYAELYYYFYNPNSILNTITLEKYYDAWIAHEKLISFLQSIKETDLLEIELKTYIQLLSVGYTSARNGKLGDVSKKELTRIKNKGQMTIRKYKKHLNYNDDITCYAISQFDSIIKCKTKIKRFINKERRLQLFSFVRSLFKYIYFRLIFPIHKKIYRFVYTYCKRKRLRNDNFSIICSNCIGGFIYHRLGKQFLSPTINCYINPKDFIKFCSNLKYYISLKLKFIPYDKTYPVAMLDDIYVFFNHSSNKEDAERDWERRKIRINYDNLYVILYDQHSLDEERASKEDILQLKPEKFKNIVVLSEVEYPDIPFVLTIKKNERPQGALYFDTDKYGIKTYEKNFDYVGFLNHYPQLNDS